MSFSIVAIASFAKELKQLAKKYASIKSDLLNLQAVLLPGNQVFAPSYSVSGLQDNTFYRIVITSVPQPTIHKLIIPQPLYELDLNYNTGNPSNHGSGTFSKAVYVG